MSDFNSELPIRSQLPGQTNYDDVIVKVGDGTNPTTQLLGVDASGRVTVKLNDGAGNSITSQTNGGQQALDVMPQTAGPVVPGTAANFSDLIGGQFNATLPTLTDGQQSAVQLDNRGRVLVTSSNFPTVVDTNYGTVGANTIRTAAQIGNATGAADFNFGASSAQTLRVAALLGNAAGVIDYNYGTIGAQSIRAAAQIGNATGAADFNNGATGAQTLRVAANLAVGGANVTVSNPVPVFVTSSTGGTNVNDYKMVTALAANASDNHDYAITATKTFSGRFFWAAASGMIKAEVQISPDGTTFTTKWVGFNSTAEPNISIQLDNLIVTETGAGSKIRIIITNRDKAAQDVYSTISGQEA